MAENNEFFREVEEDYRRDQIARIWKRHGTLIVALAILVVAGIGGWRYWQHTELVRAEAASERFDTANRLAADGKAEEAGTAFASLNADGPAGYRMLARFRAAADLGKRDAAAAAQSYDGLAADPGLDDGLRDLARLRAALLRLDGSDPAAALTSLQGLAAANGTYRHTAREMLGLTALKRGEPEAAGRWFEQITADSDTPQGLLQRVEVYQALVSGGTVALTEAKTETKGEAAPDAKAPEPPGMTPQAPPEASPEGKPDEKPEAAAPPPITR